MAAQKVGSIQCPVCGGMVDIHGTPQGELRLDFRDCPHTLTLAGSKGGNTEQDLKDLRDLLHQMERLDRRLEAGHDDLVDIRTTILGMMARLDAVLADLK